MRIGRRQVKCSMYISSAVPKCSKATSEMTVTIAPGEEIILPGKLQLRNRNFKCGVVEPETRFSGNHDVLVAKTLVDVQQDVIPVRVFNLRDSLVTVYKGTCVAVCEPITSDDVMQDKEKRLVGVLQEPVAQENTDVLPEHLVKLYQASCKDLNRDQRRHLACMLKNYQDVFAKDADDLGRTSAVQHEINTGSTRPIRQPPRRLPIYQRQVVREEIDKMLKRGVIEPSSSPWASPIVLVKKKDGSTRFCVDYRKINASTIKASYPLPRIDDTLDTLSGSKWFSTLDLASGYWQVEMSDKDKQKTAFITNQGLYEFRVMPFGLCNAPATFEQLMERVLSGLQWQTCLVYIDDIIVYGDSFQLSMQRLQEVLTRIRKAGLKLSPKKCHLFQKSVNFLGHVVSHEGIQTDPVKTESVEKWPIPRTVTDVRSFLGLCSYYRRFVKGFAETARPLHRLTEKTQNFVWSQECDNAFRELKRALISAPILVYPTSEDTFILYTRK